jgi:hypothetical protein
VRKIPSKFRTSELFGGITAVKKMKNWQRASGENLFLLKENTESIIGKAVKEDNAF